jgi:DNA helicase TIP49 (TBP-interacting protein)
LSEDDDEEEVEVEEDADEKGEDVGEGEALRAMRGGIRPSFSKAEKEGRSSTEMGDCGKVGEEYNDDGPWYR